MNIDEFSFSQFVFAYTRAQALADGVQIEVSKVAAEAGIRIPVFLTRAVFDNYVAVPPGVTCQDEAARLWDLMTMLGHAIRCKARLGQDRLPLALYIRNDDRSPRLVKLIAICGAVDIHDPRPSITILLPTED